MSYSIDEKKSENTRHFNDKKKVKVKSSTDKKYGIGLYEKSTLQSKKIKNPKFYGYTGPVKPNK